MNSAELDAAWSAATSGIEDPGIASYVTATRHADADRQCRPKKSATNSRDGDQRRIGREQADNDRVGIARFALARRNGSRSLDHARSISSATRWEITPPRHAGKESVPGFVRSLPPSRSTERRLDTAHIGALDRAQLDDAAHYAATMSLLCRSRTIDAAARQLRTDGRPERRVVTLLTQKRRELPINKLRWSSSAAIVHHQTLVGATDRRSLVICPLSGKLAPPHNPLLDYRLDP
jgi:hypothetical protein